MIRRAFNWAAGVSLLLCITSIGLGLRSFQSAIAATDWLGSDQTSAGRFLQEIAVDRGVIRWTKLVPTGAPSDPSAGTAHWRVADVDGLPSHLIVENSSLAPQLQERFVWASDSTSADEVRLIQFPLWATALAGAVLPLIWLQRRGFFRERQVAHCGRCGEDLRGATEGACPKCGTRFAPLKA